METTTTLENTYIYGDNFHQASEYFHPIVEMSTQLFLKWR